MNTKKQYTVISTFAGCGGSSLGYHWAGFKELLAIDFDKNAVETFALNFPTVPVWQRDITTVTGKEILDFLKIKKGELDILDGSPPCQGFSLVNTNNFKNINDKRNDLFMSFSELIKELKPKVFVMENVKGMISGDMKGRFNEIFTHLKSLGYNVKVKLMNAMWYEVPQSRERLIFIGLRKDLKADITFPKPLKKVITIKQALKGLKDIGVNELPNGKAKDLIKEMKQGEDGAIVLERRGAVKRSFFSLDRMTMNKPCNTITKTIRLGQSGLVHPTENRFFGINELKRLASFPDDYKFTGKFIQQWARIGNAVMPKMMYHIAKNIRENILDSLELKQYKEVS